MSGLKLSARWGLISLAVLWFAAGAGWPQARPDPDWVAAHAPVDSAQMKGDVPTASLTINKIYITDVRDTSFVVSWTTSAPSDGHVDWGSSTALGNTQSDAVTGTVHRVLIPVSTPASAYYFRVRSNGVTQNNNGDFFVATTTSTIGIPPAGQMVWGYILQADGVTPAANAVVYLQMRDKDGLGSSGASQWVTAHADASGVWYYTLGNARNAAGSAYFQFTAGVDELYVIARGGIAGVEERLQIIPTAEIAQIADLVLAVAAPATSPQVTPALSGGTDVELSWLHNSVNAVYEVWSSTTPYFAIDQPGAHKLGDVEPPLQGSSVSYTDRGAAGNPATNHFYLVVPYGLGGVKGPSSIRMGEFDFQISPGL